MQFTNKLLTSVVILCAIGFAGLPFFEVHTHEQAFTSGIPQIDTSRSITIQLVAAPQDTNAPLVLHFEPEQLTVHPGQEFTFSIHVANHAHQAKRLELDSIIWPGVATTYFTKLKCVCFEQFTLPGQSHQSLTMRAYLQHDLPNHIHTVSLTYRITPMQGYNGALISMP